MSPRLRFTALAIGLACAACAAQAQPKPSNSTAAAPRAAAPAASAAAPAQPANTILSDPDMEKGGQTAAHAWLLLLDRRDWGTAWDASAGSFRQSVSLSLWMDNVPGLRQPFGNFIEREPAEALYTKKLAGRPDGDYVTVHFLSKFDKNPRVVETVTTVREPDGRWRVAGYTAR
jgi:hypothetical protein